MTLIKKPSEINKDIKLKILVYGEPGTGKTTLALSSPNPLLIDFDNGLHRVSKQYQTDSVQVESYQNLLDILTKEDISDYKTIVIDTLGKMVDRIGDWLALSNPKVKQSDGQLSMKGWGNVKAEFQRLLKLLDNKNKSVVFVAHAREEKDGDLTKQRPDVSGSSGKDIVKELDCMGFVSMVGNKRTIDLMPNEKYYAKKQERDNEISQEYNNLISAIDESIEKLENVEQVNEYYSNQYQKKENVWSSHIHEKHKLSEKVKELDLVFNKKDKIFEVKEQKKNVAEQEDVAESLTWADVADFYKLKTGNCARIKPVDWVYEWAAKQKEIKVIDDSSLVFKKERKTND